MHINNNYYARSVLTLYYMYFKFIGSGADIAAIVVPIVTVLIITVILISVTVIAYNLKCITKRKDHRGKYTIKVEILACKKFGDFITIRR